MDQYFDQIDRIIAARKISFRVIFMLRDVVELRANKWVPLREESHFPMFVDHANKTQPKKILERKQAAKKDKRKKGWKQENFELIKCCKVVFRFVTKVGIM